MRKYFSLNKLDEYAKSLSTKQVNMLYEHRVKKTYSKMLCEEQNISQDDYKVLIYKKDLFDTFGTANMSDAVHKLIEAVKKNQETGEYDENIKFNDESLTGVWIYTDMPTSYIDILHRLAMLGLSEKVENSVDEDFIKHLYPEF